MLYNNKLASSETQWIPLYITTTNCSLKIEIGFEKKHWMQAFLRVRTEKLEFFIPFDQNSHWFSLYGMVRVIFVSHLVSHVQNGYRTNSNKDLFGIPDGLATFRMPADQTLYEIFNITFEIYQYIFFLFEQTAFLWLSSNFK
jgi:hypothetical protein